MSELRKMRDQVYSQRTSDNNWFHCEEKWRGDQRWLRDAFDRLPRPLPEWSDLPLPKTEFSK